MFGKVAKKVALKTGQNATRPLLAWNAPQTAHTSTYLAIGVALSHLSQLPFSSGLVNHIFMVFLVTHL